MKKALKILFTAALCHWSGAVAGEDKLEVIVEVAEILCGESGKPIEVCDEVDVAFRSNMMGKGINEVFRHATSRATFSILTTAGRSVDHEHEVLGGTMKVGLVLSEVESGRVTIDVSYKIEMPDDQSVQGYTQLVSTLNGEALPISGGTTTFKSEEREQADKVVRVLLLKAKRL